MQYQRGNDSKTIELEFQHSREFHLTGDIERRQGELAGVVAAVQAADIVVDEYRERIVHGAWGKIHEFVEVCADHQVDTGFVQKGDEVDIEPALEQIIVLVRMVDHRDVYQADLDRSTGKKRLLHRLAGPSYLLIDIILIHGRAAVEDGTAMAGLTAIGNDEGDRTLPEGIVEWSRIFVREDICDQLRVVATAFMVATGKEHRKPGSKRPERFKFIADKRISHIVACTDDVAVEEEEIRSGRVDLRGQSAIFIYLIVDVIEN